jgi:hypothetical protein
LGFDNNFGVHFFIETSRKASEMKLQVAKTMHLELQPGASRFFWKTKAVILIRALALLGAGAAWLPAIGSAQETPVVKPIDVVYISDGGVVPNATNGEQWASEADVMRYLGAVGAWWSTQTGRPIDLTSRVTFHRATIETCQMAQIFSGGDLSAALWALTGTPVTLDAWYAAHPGHILLTLFKQSTTCKSTGQVVPWLPDSAGSARGTASPSLDWGGYMRSTNPPANTDGYQTFTTESTLAHELGHVFGLGHDSGVTPSGYHQSCLDMRDCPGGLVVNEYAWNPSIMGSNTTSVDNTKPLLPDGDILLTAGQKYLLGLLNVAAGGVKIAPADAVSTQNVALNTGGVSGTLPRLVLVPTADPVNGVSHTYTYGASSPYKVTYYGVEYWPAWDNHPATIRPVALTSGYAGPHNTLLYKYSSDRWAPIGQGETFVFPSGGISLTVLNQNAQFATVRITPAAVGPSSGYTVTVSAGAGGTVSPPGPLMLAPGAFQTFRVMPHSGHYISSINGCGLPYSGDGSYTGYIDASIYVTNSCTVTATFARHP